jgi:hypothetical protein
METSELKLKFQDKEIFTESEKKEIKKNRNISGVNAVSFAKVFLSAYDTFKNNLNPPTPEQIEYFDRFKEKAERFRVLIEDYDTSEINNYFPEVRIKKEIDRELMNELIMLFFAVFIEEESFL